MSPLGAGGMGEVYRATDVRLGRQVAVKVLPEHLAADAEALARFEREARAVAALSHPAICTLHDVGREGEATYLVMELLEGETLAERILKGPLPLEQVFKLGTEIGSALAAAHERGIAHRDLKPGNIMLTRSGLKLLDFGLAKALEAAHEGPQSPGPTASVQLHATQAGTLLGTLPYMSPEQLEGRGADARSDIFAFGAVLYEMATGQRAFSGRSQASLISAILTSEPPPISTQRALSPIGLDQLVRTCLAKDPLERWQSVRDVVLQLRTLADAQPAAPLSPEGRRSAWLAWGVAGLASALLLASVLRPRPAQTPPARTVKFTVAPPPGGAFGSWVEGTAIAVSPDGSTLAFVARESNGPRRLWVRPLASTESRPLPGSEDAGVPFWSPDGRSLAFTAQGKLKRVDLAGGSSVSICDVRGTGVAGTWGRDSILFVGSSADAETLLRVPAAGGTPLAAITIDRSKGERRLAWPAFLPDGEHYLYGVRHEDFSWHLMVAGPAGTPREIGAIASAAQFAGPGHLVFVREGTLVGQPFDWKTGRLSGQPSAIAESVRYFLSTGSAAFSASPAGTLAYQSREDTNRLVWFDRAGHEQGSIGAPGVYLNVSISPDGRRVLYDRARAQTGTYDIWSWDLALRGESRLTSHPDTETCPRWLPDGVIVYSATLRAGPPQLVRRDLATGQERELPSGGRFQLADDVSPDGRTLLYNERGPSETTDLWALSLVGAPEPRAVLATPFAERGARFSPDGRYLAFVSDESGSVEAYVTPYPGPGQKQRISQSGARNLRWSRDGRELLLLSADNRLWSVPVRTAPSFQAGTPTLLFAIASKPWLSFDVAPDGQRILAIVPEIAGNELPATVVVNWAAETVR